MIRIPFEKMQKVFTDILHKYNMPAHKAQRCATVFAQSSLDGVYSHGVNRFPLFVQHLQQGFVNLEQDPECIMQTGPFERYEGHLGPGIWNAGICMDRAIALAKTYSLGCVGLRHTNHWMRGGAYGWQAVEAGCAAICFTNTKPNMPAWGAKSATVGNNPLIIAIPHESGPVVLDMSMSLYSYGKMENYKLNGQELPFPGGFDEAGNLTQDPGAIIQTERTLPVGYWKGSGLSMMLDLLASVLSAGKTTHQIGSEPIEYALSQVFICFDMEKLGELSEQLIEDVKLSLREADLAEGSTDIFYPGQRTLATRKENREKGIPVVPAVWEKVMGL